MTKSCFFPGKETLFFHDPNEIFINADLTIPLIRRPGDEESIPESAEMPLDNSYYEDVSDEASEDEDEDDDDESGSEIGKQRMTWWCSSALKQVNEDRHEMAEPQQHSQILRQLNLRRDAQQAQLVPHLSF